MLTGQDAVEALIVYARSEKGAWPKAAECKILEGVNTWIALRESDRVLLKAAAGWTDRRREYRVDPLAERIADAWAHYLFGDDPEITAGAAGDQTLLDQLLGDEHPAELERAATLCVSEGEIWSRIYVDLDELKPCLEWVSRTAVFPLWRGATLIAAAVVTELPYVEGNPKGEVWRHFEIHAVGLVVNVLFKGKATSLGALVVDPAAHPMTADLEPVWNHRLPFMLVDRIPNRLRRTPTLGVSDFSGILDHLLDLNEAAAIGAHNMRLTARKRAIISAGAARAITNRSDLELTPEENPAGVGPPRPSFDVGEEVFVEDPLDQELGGAKSDPFKILEYSFDAQALIAYKADLVESALSRIGLTGQYVGVGDPAAGYAISGTALRLRLIPTDKTGRGKGRYWDGRLPRIYGALQAVDRLPSPQGGFGRAWGNAAALPTIVRRPGIPVDELEEAQRHSTLLSAGAESIENAVRELHPDWEAGRVDEEVAAIRADKDAAAAASPFGA